MKRLVAGGKSATGVHHVAKVTSIANCIFHSIPQENDLGLDAYIEFIVEQEATGCCIGVQIKSGTSYMKAGRPIIPCDEKHKAYWRSHALPIAGIVYNPETDSAHWVDITESLNGRDNSECSFLDARADFDVSGFPAFQNHFLTYREQYSDDAYFARSLRAFSG